MSPNPPAPGIVGRFRSIVERLCCGLARHAERDWTATAFVNIIVQKLRGRLARFVALKARFDAGLPPPLPRPVSERSPGEREPCERAFDFVPSERGWLMTTTEQDGAASFWQLRDLLAEPEMAAFIASDPRVGRLLRPLWWMLSPKLDPPEVLLPPVLAAPAKRAVPRAVRGASPARPRWVCTDRIPGSGPPIPA